MQTIEQIINVSVVDAASSTGAGSSALADTGAPTLMYLSIALALIAIAIAITVFTSRKRHGAVRRSSFYSFILAIALGGGIATLAFGQPVAHAAASLALTGDSTASVTVPRGGTATAPATLAASTDSTAGYSLTATLASAEPGIVVSLSGGDIAASTSVPTTSAAPLALKNTTTANATGTQDTIPVTITVTADSALPPAPSKLPSPTPLPTTLSQPPPPCSQ